MQSRNKVTMCRLCLCENECFFNIFDMNDWHGYVAAEVISDLFHCQVSETDAYPNVVCSTCLTKLTDFKLFKECCLKSKDAYDDMFASSETLVKPDLEEEASLAVNGFECCEEDPLKDTSSIEVGHDGIKLEFHEQDPLRDASSDNDVKTFNLQPKDEDIDSNEVEPTLVEAVAHPKYLHCLEYGRPHCTSNGEADEDSCSNDDSLFEKSAKISLCEDVEASSSGTMERLDGQRILQGESINKVPHGQQETSIGKDVKKERGEMEEDIGGESEGWKITGQDKGVIERREGLECFHCGIVLLSKRSLIQHMEVHGFVNSYDCAICDKVFHFHSDFVRHGLSHTDSMRFNCAECSKSFSQKGSLNRHMILHRGSKPYKCTECSKCFSEKGSLKRHMRIHSGSKPYKCAECSKSFSEKGNLTNHMRLHTGSKPYKCAECSKCFRDKSSLNRHIRLHTDSKPYKCAECSKSFRKKQDLNIHMRSHTASILYKCAECSKCYTRNDSLNRHMRLHIDSKPYKCTECSKCYSDKNNLNKHRKLHSGLIP